MPTRSAPVAIRRFKHEIGIDGPAHTHAEGQLFVHRRGTATLRTTDAAWLMTPNRPCWVPPGVVHSALSTGAVSGVSLFLAPGLCRRLPKRLLVVDSHPLLLQIIDRLDDVELSAQRRQRLVGVLVDEITAATEDRLHLPMPRDLRLATMAGLIASAPDDRRSLGEWATELAMSERSLVRHFRNETGLTLIEWRRRARVMRAAVLLDGGASVTETALAVGYDSSSAFGAAYRLLTGRSPTAQRRG